MATRPETNPTNFSASWDIEAVDDLSGPFIERPFQKAFFSKPKGSKVPTGHKVWFLQ